jgi:hypothetical protein
MILPSIKVGLSCIGRCRGILFHPNLLSDNDKRLSRSLKGFNLNSPGCNPGKKGRYDEPSTLKGLNYECL